MKLSERVCVNMYVEKIYRNLYILIFLFINFTERAGWGEGEKHRFVVLLIDAFFDRFLHVPTGGQSPAHWDRALTEPQGQGWTCAFSKPGRRGTKSQTLAICLRSRVEGCRRVVSGIFHFCLKYFSIACIILQQGHCRRKIKIRSRKGKQEKI